jgi:mono/diheme cytochrome c family protein
MRAKRRSLAVFFAVLLGALALLEAEEGRSWTLEHFDPLLAVGLEGYRDFENGRRSFRAAACGECHRLGGSGKEGGHELGGVKDRLDPRALLGAILGPPHAASGAGGEGGRPVDSLDEESVLDLLAYLLSGAREDDAMFAR